MPTSEDIKCHTVMARIGGWTTHKACGAWRGEFIGLMAMRYIGTPHLHGLGYRSKGGNSNKVGGK